MKLLRSADFRADGRRRGARWLARVLVASALMVTAVLPLGSLTTAPAHAAGGTTVLGPAVWIPNTNPDDSNDPNNYLTGTYGDQGTVTVDQTDNVANQVLHVSWTGFTPSNDGQGNPVTVVSTSSTLYPVRIYECRGTNPLVTDCYGSSQYNQDPKKGFDQPSAPAGGTAPDFPPNTVTTLTRADGTGEANIEVWTSKESPSLGCDSHHACSIVVEPNYGGDALGDAPDPTDPSGEKLLAPDCENHSQDTAQNPTVIYGSLEATDDTLSLKQDPTTGFQSGERCAWNNHVVIPLSFAPTASDCKSANSDISAEGLPMFARAGTQWISGLCLNRSPLYVQYSSGLTEPQARTDFLQGVNSDVAFTARPADPQLSHARPYVYAPLANSSIAVVFLIDNPDTGQQLLNMRLNARLMAKMLTQSYTYEYDGAPVIHSVAGNPFCIFLDPEFIQLNPPDLNGGTPFPSNCGGGALTAPIVSGGKTDLVQQVTSWIASDPDARAFLQGAPDPWGMHVDTYYLPSVFSGYPTDTFVPQDSSGEDLPVLPKTDPQYENNEGLRHSKSFEWNPIQSGLTGVARNLLNNQATCLITYVDSPGNHPKCGAENVGARNLFGIIDAGQAAAYRFPTAALLNPAGQFVQPTLNGMAKAVGDMATDKATGTQSLPYGVTDSAFSKDSGAYPLTTVQYAMLPTGGVSATKAGKIAQFVSTITSSSGGQVYGPAPGQLAVGYLALTPAQQAQATAAARHVASQDGIPPAGAVTPIGGGAKAPTGATGNTNSGGHTTSVGAKPPATQAPAAGAAAAAARARNQSLGPLSVTGVAHPDQSDPSRLVLPLALIAGLVFLLGGPLGAVLLGTGVGSGLVRRIRNAAGGR